MMNLITRKLAVPQRQRLWCLKLISKTDAARRESTIQRRVHNEGLSKYGCASRWDGMVEEVKVQKIMSSGRGRRTEPDGRVGVGPSGGLTGRTLLVFPTMYLAIFLSPSC